MTTHAYIAACKDVINSANHLNNIICAERARFKSDSVMFSDGPASDALEQLKTALNDLRIADHQLEKEPNLCGQKIHKSVTNPAADPTVT